METSEPFIVQAQFFELLDHLLFLLHIRLPLNIFQLDSQPLVIQAQFFQIFNSLLFFLRILFRLDAAVVELNTEPFVIPAQLFQLLDELLLFFWSIRSDCANKKKLNMIQLSLIKDYHYYFNKQQLKWFNYYHIHIIIY